MIKQVVIPNIYMSGECPNFGPLYYELIKTDLSSIPSYIQFSNTLKTLTISTSNTGNAGLLPLQIRAWGTDYTFKDFFF